MNANQETLDWELAMAAEWALSGSARHLLDAGANPNSRHSPLAKAATKGDLPMMRLLIECGAHVNHKHNRAPMDAAIKKLGAARAAPIVSLLEETTFDEIASEALAAKPTGEEVERKRGPRDGL